MYGNIAEKKSLKIAKKQGLTMRRAWVEVLDVVMMVAISDWLFVTFLYRYWLCAT